MAVVSTSKVTEENNTDNDENDKCLPQRSMPEVYQALEILRQFVQQNVKNFD